MYRFQHRTRPEGASGGYKTPLQRLVMVVVIPGATPGGGTISDRALRTIVRLAGSTSVCVVVRA